MINLYDLDPVQAALVDESSGLPPGIVTQIYDDYGGAYSEDLLQSGIIVHPQIVAAIALTLGESYVYALLSQDHEVGASLVYGSVLLGRSGIPERVYDMACSAFEPDIDLPVETLDLIEHAFEAAANLRARTTDDSKEKNVVNLSEMVKMSVEDAIDFGHYQRPTTPAPHPTFDRFCEMFNQIREAVVEGRRVDDAFFQSKEPSTENYLRAIFGSKLEHDCPVRQQAREYLKALDPVISNWIFRPR
ncbi:MAG: hypothetical protein ACKO5F_14625 [Synechococcus sp.]